MSQNAQIVRTDKNSSVLSQNDFIIITLAVSFGWLLVSLWQRVVENTAYGTLGLNDVSAFHALVVALAATVLFFLIIWLLNVYNIVPGIESGIAEQSIGSTIPDETTATSTTNI